MRRRPIWSEAGKISSKMLKELFDTAFEKRRRLSRRLRARRSRSRFTDTAAIEKMIDEVIAANPKQVEQYRAGKKTVVGFFVGQVMKLSKGQANPALLNELVKRQLGG